MNNKHKTIETLLNQNNEFLKFNHYLDQNRTENKKGEYKINEHKEKGNDVERDGNQPTARSNKIPRKNNNLATVSNIRQVLTEKKKKIFIVSDSLFKNFTETGISREHNVKIRPQPGATSVDMCEYISRNYDDVIILHCGTNGISNEINTLKKLKKLLKKLERYDTHKKPQVVIYSLIKR